MCVCGVCVQEIPISVPQGLEKIMEKYQNPFYLAAHNTHATNKHQRKKKENESETKPKNKIQINKCVNALQVCVCGICLTQLYRFWER